MITTYLIVYNYHLGKREKSGSYKYVQWHLLPTSENSQIKSSVDKSLYSIRLTDLHCTQSLLHNTVAVELFPDDFAKFNAFRKHIF